MSQPILIAPDGTAWDRPALAAEMRQMAHRDPDAVADEVMRLAFALRRCRVGLETLAADCAEGLTVPALLRRIDVMLDDIKAIP